MEDIPMSNLNLSEKVSVNVNTSVLSQIDMLVDNGYFSNRSDFINHALRVALEQQRSTIERLISQNEKKDGLESSWFIGVSGLTAKEVDELYADGVTENWNGYGVFVIDNNVDEQKLFTVVKSIKIKGKVICSETVKQHYGI